MKIEQRSVTSQKGKVNKSGKNDKKNFKFQNYWQKKVITRNFKILRVMITIEYRIVVYIRFGFFGKFSTPICLIKVYTFISSDIFLFLYVYFNLYVLVELD